MGEGHPPVPRRPEKAQAGFRRWAWVLSAALVALLLGAEAGLRLTASLLARGEPLRTRASAGARTIYCIGDSFTWGMGVRPEKAWPALLQEMINQASATKRADVNNLGFPGLSSANAVVAVARAIQQEDAGVILVMAGWNANDTDFIQHARERSLPVPLIQRIEDALEVSRLYRALKQAATYRRRTALLDQVEIVPQTEMELYDFRAYQEIAYKNLRRIARLCREFGVPLILLNYPYRDLPPNEYSKNEYYHVLYGRTRIGPSDYVAEDRLPDEIAVHAIIRRVGEEEGVRVIDFQDAFVRSKRSPERLFQRDYHHPTVVGHAIMARAVVRSIGAELVRMVDTDGKPPPGD